MLTQQQEIQNMIAFFKRHRLAWLDDEGSINGNFFADYLVQWSAYANKVIEATPENLAVAYETLKKANRPFIYYTAVKAEYEELGEKFTEGQRNILAAGLARQGYWPADEQHQLSNWNHIARAWLARGYQDFTNRNVDIVVGNLLNSQQGHLLHKKEQPSKFNAVAAAEAVAKTPKVQPDESQLTVIKKGDHPDAWVRPLSPELQAHQASLRVAMAQAEAQKTPPQSTSPDSELYWKGRVSQFLAWIPENLIRIELAAEFAISKNGNWEFTYRELEHAYERRKYERSVDRGGNF